MQGVVGEGRRGAPRLALAIGGSLLVAGLAIGGGPAIQPAAAESFAQCDDLGNGGGQGIVCTVEIVNTLDNHDPLAPVMSSTMTVTRCAGAAGAALAGECVTTGPLTSARLFTDVNQCNYAVNGGGATLDCRVSIINRITGTGTVFPATVNQCNNSLDTGDVFACDPTPSTTDPSTATVIECNDSVNGGGSVIDCIVDPTSVGSVEIPIHVNQCNNSANGGGSVILCRVTLATLVTPWVPPVVEEEEGEEDEGEEDTPVVVTAVDTGGTTPTGTTTTVANASTTASDSSAAAARERARLRALALTGTSVDTTFLASGLAVVLGLGAMIVGQTRLRRRVRRQR